MEEIGFLRQVLATTTEEAYQADEKLKRACPRSLEIIGEAVGNLPTAWLEEEPQVPWKEIVGLRNRIAHGYFSIDHQLVWQIMTHDLEALDNATRNLLFRHEFESDV